MYVEIQGESQKRSQVLGSLGKKSLRQLPATCLAIKKTEKSLALLHIFLNGKKMRDRSVFMYWRKA